MNENFAFKIGYELHYRDINPKIIIEKFIENKGADDLYDYKFWCYNGKVKYIQFLSGRNLSGLKMAFYDKNWIKQDFYNNNEFDERVMPKPKSLDKMVELAEILSESFNYVRVDFYQLENGEIYKPSNGERGILLMQKLLDSESDVYILDEPELGMGNSYITSNILLKLTDLAKRRKTVIIATHNANIAVGTLPYISILRTHENGVYKTYVGNPFYDELRNIDDETDIKNWTQESMHTLEGGKNAFYDRKDIYESGK